VSASIPDQALRGTLWFFTGNCWMRIWELRGVAGPLSRPRLTRVLDAEEVVPCAKEPVWSGRRWWLA